MSTPNLFMVAVVAALAAPILHRTTTTLYRASRMRYGENFRYQGFALGYAALGSLTVSVLIDALMNAPVPGSTLGFMAASDLLILFYDRRRTDGN